jgi:peptidoglycan glycosyltransferase
VNVPITRLFALVIVLFAVLIGFTSRWSVFEAQALRDNSNNRRELFAEARIKRGAIRADDGTLLARSVRQGPDRWSRAYPTGPLFGQAVGCWSLDSGQAGLEKAYNDPLSGRRTELIGIVDRLLGPRDVGDDLRTTLDPKAQRAAFGALAGRRGAVVALDVHSGAVRVMASNPGFDPGKERCGSKLDLATQGLFPPGSTFKTVTATAALDSGEFQPSSTIDAPAVKEISGTPLHNFSDESFGRIDLTTALTHSVNTAWAQVGEKLGRGTMAEYMTRFGFGEDPPMDFPDGEMVASGERRANGKLLPATSGAVDVGRMAIGQDKLLVTPLQMASVAQTIGNGGMRMKPRLVQKIVDPDGRTVDEPLPQEAQRVMSADSAAKLTAMMKNVVREGTGTAAALQGVELAGKTGTAEVDIARGINDLWFIGFTGKVAVAVVLDHVQGGQGGTVAAPVAKQVLEALGAA